MIMKRQIKAKLIHWKNKKTRKPLLLQGARQVGKTYVLQDFAKSQFVNSHYFDLEELKTDLSSIFSDSPLDPKQLIDKLSFVSGKSINIKKVSYLNYGEHQSLGCEKYSINVLWIYFFVNRYCK